MADDDRQRVAAAIIRDGRVLMVRERGRLPNGRHEGGVYLTLPGGGIEAGESPEQAVVREVEEEVCLVVKNPRLVFRFPFPNGVSACYLVEADASEPAMGDEHLACDCPRLLGIEWVALHPLADGSFAIPTFLRAIPADFA